MAFWSRPHRQEVRPIAVPAPRTPASAGEVTELDRMAQASFLVSSVDDPEAAWRALETDFPAAGADDEAHLAVVVATPLAGPGGPPTLLFVTGSRLIAAGNQGPLVAFDFARLQSVGRVAAGFPQLQVLVESASGPADLELGVYEMAPNKWSGAFWRELSEAVRAARPDLPEHAAGAYDGLGVPAVGTHSGPASSYLAGPW